MHKRSGYVPLSKVTIFFLLSAGLYIFPWFYKNRKYLMEKLKSPDHSLIDTLLLAIPVVNLVMLYDQQSLTKDLLKEKKKEPDVQPPAVVGLTIVLGIIATISTALIIFAFIIPFIMQRDLNKTTANKEYWIITVGEFIMIAIGLFAWISILS